MTNDQDDASPERAGEPGSPALSGQTASIANIVQTRLLGIGLLALALLLAYLFLMLWPSGLSTETKGDEGAMICLGTRMCFIATVDVRLLMIVMVAGALGSFIHTATSFGDFVGNNKLSSNWIWWYILRPFIGTVLAAIFYLVVRGGFLSSGSQAGHINLYGIVALAGMVGMFSKQATDKLGEVFDTLFKTTAGGGDSKRKDSLENPVPVLAKIDPSTVEPASRNAIIALSGAGFVSGSVMRIKGSNRNTEFKDSTRLAATLSPDDLANEGQLDVAVFNPPPGGGTSASLTIRVGAPPASTAVQGDTDNHVDGCDVEVLSPTADEDLPAAHGGVAR